MYVLPSCLIKSQIVDYHTNYHAVREHHYWYTVNSKCFEIVSNKMLRYIV